jgi:ubiquinone biosynthesis protein UbiJ
MHDARAYNPCMLHSLTAALNHAVMERATLWLNHVLSGEPVAAQRLVSHAGRRIRVRFDGWPSLLPALPPAVFLITPAGLLEWCGDEAQAPAGDADLNVAVDVSNPALAFAQALSGERPKVEVSGDAAFASDLNWLVDNLRWDYEDDLARVIGPAPARELARLASGAAAGLRALVRAVGPRGSGAGGPGHP